MQFNSISLIFNLNEQVLFFKFKNIDLILELNQYSSHPEYI